nr:glycosyltransferase family 4 protein [Verrucomicrobiota bacterium]
MELTEKPLRILVIVNLPWDSRLGAARVWMELAEQWRALGHTVEKFTLSDAFPGVRATRVTFALRQLMFIGKAKAFVRQNAQRFDVIDALIGALPLSKEELDFSGVIVARSVGFYGLYDRFDQSVAQRWPQAARGKLAGRFLYRYTRRRFLRASERAVRSADLINVPNEEEGNFLRKELGLENVIVQPYGLTSDRRQALAATAADGETRLAQRRVCFIGMWGARKGSYDWPHIIRRIRQDLPETRFRFLGTMLDAARIKAELGEVAARDVEFISDFAPENLPALLADCTVGGFPSYVEGFGLAVIEQLAAGLPTVAYNVAGPRDILQTDFADQLVASGDIEAFSKAIVRLLRLPPAAYDELSKRSRQSVERFCWSQIARETIDEYQKLLDHSTRPLVFVQPFSLGWAGGGARILRALTARAPFAWRSVCTSPSKPKSWSDEIHLRSRPSWGKIEHSRMAALPKATMRFFEKNFRRRLRRRCQQLKARAIHAVPHSGTDFATAQQVARDLSLPFFLSLHDDLAYTSGSISKRRESAMQSAWREAAACFVISNALGQEYC